MTPTELRECLAALHWTQRGLAAILGCDEGLVRRWARGAAEIPSDVAQWLRGLAQHHRQHPPPTWKRRAA
jgi:transcriptional regulator with XRE-family HTH domain